MVNQVYCAALSCGYSGVDNKFWEPLARIILEATYEATLLAAIQMALASACSDSGDLNRKEDEDKEVPHRVYLTFLGGGVFRNESAWIAQAIGRALAVVTKQYAFVNLHVVVCHFRRINSDMRDMIDESFREELDV